MRTRLLRFGGYARSYIHHRHVGVLVKELVEGAYEIHMQFHEEPAQVNRRDRQNMFERKVRALRDEQDRLDTAPPLVVLGVWCMVEHEGGRAHAHACAFPQGRPWAR